MELAEFGAEGFYFDEIPQPMQGCWCDYCRKKFKAWSGLALPKTMNATDPVYRKLLEFTTVSVLEHYNEITETINAKYKDIALLISTSEVPCADDGDHIYESSLLINSTLSTVSKTEFTIPDRKPCTLLFQKGRPFSNSNFSADVLISLGWSRMRDAASGRPPHVWIPRLVNSSQSIAAAFALMTYGAVANPNHVEHKIPDFSLFHDTYTMEATLATDVFARRMRPLRWAGVFFSENARNAFLPQNDTAAWEGVLFPTVAAWETLIRQRVPVGVLSDWQLSNNPPTPPTFHQHGPDCQCQHGASAEVNTGADLYRQGYRALVMPIAAQTTEQAEVLKEFETAGGTVINVNASANWTKPSSRSQLENALWEDILARAGPPPVQVAITHKTVSDTFVHAVPFHEPDVYNHFVIFLTLDFRWVYLPTGMPTPLDDLQATVVISNSKATSVTASSLLPFRPIATKTTGVGKWHIDLPRIEKFLAVNISCTPACW
eukprot:m.148667 g.148667  ORF g.148667 m.148667 type:complete len:490 (+) comp38501_c0_seq3:575-2044(+)